MTKTSIAVALTIGGVIGCNNCEALTEKICADLGAEDCQAWKQANGPDILYSGRRSERFCINVRFNPSQYSPMITGAKAVAAAQKKAAQARAGKK